MKTKKEGNFEIELWYERYRRDFLPVSKKIDDWYQAYRKDFMPNASGRIEGYLSLSRGV
jgi:hypothetical protein